MESRPLAGKQRIIRCRKISHFAVLSNEIGEILSISYIISGKHCHVNIIVACKTLRYSRFFEYLT